MLKKRSWLGLFIIVIGICIGPCADNGYATIVIGSSIINPPLKEIAAVYRWHEDDWMCISPESGAGLADRHAVYALCFYRGQLYAGTNGGQVYTYSGKTTWIRTGWNGNAIPPNADVISLTVHKGRLYAGTSPAGLYEYNPALHTWTRVDINTYEMIGIAAMFSWTNPLTQTQDLYLGDEYHDMIVRYNEQNAFKELSIFANSALGASCVWDFETYQDHLYGCAYLGRIYVRPPDANETGVTWAIATPWDRGYYYTWELEVYQGNLYAGSDDTLEQLNTEQSSWNDLRFDPIFQYNVNESLPDTITAMISADRLYFSMKSGAVFQYDGQHVPQKMGSTLSTVYTMMDMSFVEDYLTVHTFNQVLNDRVPDGEELTYEISYTLSGQSSAHIIIEDEIPEVLTWVCASPEPNLVDDHKIAWDLGTLSGDTLSGVISLTLRSPEGLDRGTLLHNICTLKDGETTIRIEDQISLYDVKRLYVNPDSPTETPDGFSWETAFHALNDALRQASLFNVPELWIAKGTFTLPEELQDQTSISSFFIPPGLALYGGFAGHETTVLERDPHTNKTILENPILWDTDVVVVGSQQINTTILSSSTETLIDGCTIRGSRTTGSWSGVHASTQASLPLTLRDCNIETCGHGLFLADGSSAILDHCVIKNTSIGVSAYGTGATLELRDCMLQDNGCGAYLGKDVDANLVHSTIIHNGTEQYNFKGYSGGIVAFCNVLKVNHCRFIDNDARFGGGLFVSPQEPNAPTDITIANSEFNGNTAHRGTNTYDEYPNGQGGALALQNQAFTVQDCWFVGNTAQELGGGLSCSGCRGDIVRCIFVGNTSDASSTSHGGALLIEENSGTITVYRSVFMDNRASYGGAVVTKANDTYPTQIINCTFRENRGTYWAGGALSVCNKSDDLTKHGGWAEVTNSIFYANFGEDIGSTFEVYENGYLALNYCALDGYWWNNSYLWVEEKDRQLVGQYYIADEDNMQRLTICPFIAEATMDYHLRLPSSGQKGTPYDNGTVIERDDPYEDIDGDSIPLGDGWDMGADELNPDIQTGTYLRPVQLVYTTTEDESNLVITIAFQGIHIADPNTPPTDCIALYWNHASTDEPLTRIEFKQCSSAVRVNKTTNGLAEGFVFMQINQDMLFDGTYVVKLISCAESETVITTSHTFFIDGLPPILK